MTARSWATHPARVAVTNSLRHRGLGALGVVTDEFTQQMKPTMPQHAAQGPQMRYRETIEFRQALFDEILLTDVIRAVDRTMQSFKVGDSAMRVVVGVAVVVKVVDGLLVV